MKYNNKMQEIAKKMKKFHIFQAYRKVTNIHEYRQKLFNFLRSKEFDAECIKVALTQFLSNQEN